MSLHINGRYLLVDIGRNETKILEIQNKNKKLEILKACEMRDMSLFLDKSQELLTNIDQFALSLTNLLESEKITTRRVILCSSALGIQTNLELWNAKIYPDLKSIGDKFTQSYKPENKRCVDWSAYSTRDNTTHLIVTTTLERVMQEFIEVMEKHKYSILTITSTSEAFVGHVKLLDDEPIDNILIDLSSTSARILVNSKGNPTYLADITCEFNQLIPNLAKALGIYPAMAKKYLYTIGMRRTERTVGILKDASIDPNTYFKTLENLVINSLRELQQKIVSVQSSVISGNYTIYLSGGLLAVNGLFDFIKSNTTDMQFKLNTDLFSKALARLNGKTKTDKFNSVKYCSLLTNLICLQENKYVNLIPVALQQKYKSSKSIDKLPIMGGYYIASDGDQKTRSFYDKAYTVAMIVILNIFFITSIRWVTTTHSYITLSTANVYMENTYELSESKRKSAVAAKEYYERIASNTNIYSDIFESIQKSTEITEIVLESISSTNDTISLEYSHSNIDLNICVEKLSEIFKDTEFVIDIFETKIVVIVRY